MKRHLPTKQTLDPICLKQQTFKRYLAYATFFFIACVIASLLGMYFNPYNHARSFTWFFDEIGVTAWLFLLPCMAPCFTIYDMNSDRAIAAHWVRNYAKNISLLTAKAELQALNYDDIAWLDGKILGGLNDEQWSYYLWLISNGILAPHVPKSFVEQFNHCKNEQETIAIFMQYYRRSTENIKLLNAYQFKNRVRTQLSNNLI